MVPASHVLHPRPWHLDSSLGLCEQGRGLDPLRKQCQLLSQLLYLSVLHLLLQMPGQDLQCELGSHSLFLFPASLAMTFPYPNAQHSEGNHHGNRNRFGKMFVNLN